MSQQECVVDLGAGLVLFSLCVRTRSEWVVSRGLGIGVVERLASTLSCGEIPFYVQSGRGIGGAGLVGAMRCRSW